MVWLTNIEKPKRTNAAKPLTGIFQILRPLGAIPVNVDCSRQPPMALGVLRSRALLA